MRKDKRGIGRFVQRVTHLYGVWKHEAEEAALSPLFLVGSLQAGASRGRRHGLLRKLTGSSPMCRPRELLREEDLISMGGPMESFMGSIYKRISKGPVEEQGEGGSATCGLPGNMRRMQDASSSAVITGKCGETMEMYLRMNGERIAEAAFFTNGCRFSIICGYVAARLAEGKILDDAVQIGGDTILATLGRAVPEEEAHCAHLASETLQAAIHEWITRAPGEIAPGSS